MLLREYAARTAQTEALARFDVLGTDIDRASLETAQRGEYGAFAFTDIAADVRQTWFEPPAYTKLVPSIRQSVRFEQRDLITSDFSSGYDLIFCRNVVIYFDKATQRTLFERMAKLQRPGDYLFLGHSESLYRVSDQYELIGKTIYRRNHN